MDLSLYNLWNQGQWRGNYFWTGGGQDRDRQNRERETEV